MLFFFIRIASVRCSLLKYIVFLEYVNTVKYEMKCEHIIFNIFMNEMQICGRSQYRLLQLYGLNYRNRPNYRTWTGFVLKISENTCNKITT